MDKMKIKVDPFFTDTRINFCMADCVHANRNGQCQLKNTYINIKGICSSYTKREGKNGKK